MKMKMNQMTKRNNNHKKKLKKSQTWQKWMTKILKSTGLKNSVKQQLTMKKRLRRDSMR